jgi:hypothetical protein
LQRVRALQTTLALVAAGLAPAIIFGGFSRSLAVMPLAFGVAFAHALILGFPIFALMSHRNWVNSLTSSVIGFFIGAAPVAVFTWPTPFEIMALFGACGAVGGLAFWAVLKASDPKRGGVVAHEVVEEPRMFPSGARMLAIGVPIVLAVVLSIPLITKDRSCHNLLRDGRSSISTVLNIDLHVRDDEWTALSDLLKRFAGTHKLSLRDSSKATPGSMRALYLSLCDDGINIEVAEQRWAHNEYKSVLPGRGVAVGIYTQQESTPWPPVARKLVTDLEARWPGKVQFTDHSGRTMPKPEVLSQRD